jgi:hypothetical protein
VRKLIAAGLIAFLPTLALADENVSGQWHSNIDEHSFIEMVILADGNWDSQTVQNDTVIAQMEGTYKQTPKDARHGVIIFTPTKSQTSKEHGQATPETDQYELSSDGKKLNLTTSGDTMTYDRQDTD